MTETMTKAPLCPTASRGGGALRHVCVCVCTLVTEVVHQQHLVEQLWWRAVHHAVHGPQQRRPALVVERDDDAGVGQRVRVQLQLTAAHTHTHGLKCQDSASSFLTIGQTRVPLHEWTEWTASDQDRLGALGLSVFLFPALQRAS